MGFLAVFILVPCLHRKDDKPDGRVVRVIIILKLYPLLNFFRRFLVYYDSHLSLLSRYVELYRTDIFGGGGTVS